jgi:hypothetical protein
MPWFNRSPRVYRFLESRYVNAFFDTGALRLSSFSRFSKHANEQRLDGKEGTISLVYQPPTGGDIVLLEGAVGSDAYVLCACLVPSLDVMQSFEADSGFVIHDAQAFALAIGAAVPGFTHGFDGPCSYQARRVIQRNYFSAENAPKIPLNSAGELDKSRLGELVYPIMGQDGYFLKHHSYMHQNEWRFVWLTHGPCHDYLDIIAPEARKYCEPWSNSTRYIAFNKNGPLPPPQ